MSLALLFPGQGSQRPGMLRALPRSPAIMATVDQSRSRLSDLGLTDDIDTPAALRHTTNAQLALLIAGVAYARALTADHGLTPAFVAGHSVGAFAAAVTAGVITFDDALSTVALRGRLMEEACAERDWGMAAVRGLPTRLASQVAEQGSTVDDPVWVANVNTATQTVISGTATGLERAAGLAERLGASAFDRLDVAVASHCPIQNDTARRLAVHLAEVPRRAPTMRYLTNTRGRATMSADGVVDDLAQAVAHPVQWYDATRLMGELGATRAVEMPPGHVLTRLMASAVPAMAAISLDDAGIESAVRRSTERSQILTES